MSSSVTLRLEGTMATFSSKKRSASTKGRFATADSMYQRAWLRFCASPMGVSTNVSRICGRERKKRNLEADDDDGEHAGHVVAERDFLLRVVFVLAEFRLVPRVHHRAVSTSREAREKVRELGELELGDLQKEVLRGETDVGGVVDAHAAWKSGARRYRASNW